MNPMNAPVMSAVPSANSRKIMMRAKPTPISIERAMNVMAGSHGFPPRVFEPSLASRPMPRRPEPLPGPCPSCRVGLTGPSVATRVAHATGHHDRIFSAIWRLKSYIIASATTADTSNATAFFRRGPKWMHRKG